LGLDLIGGIKQSFVNWEVYPLNRGKYLFEIALTEQDSSCNFNLKHLTVNLCEIDSLNSIHC